MRVYSCRKRHIPVEDDDSDSQINRRVHRRRGIELRKSLDADNREKYELPVFGSMSVVGRAREMEDEISVKMNLCRLEINGFRPVHFFAVFNGHGGNHVSALCKESMHVIMEEELMRMKVAGGEVEELWKSAISRTFERIDAMAITLCQCSGLEDFNVCKHHPRLSVVESTVVVVVLTQDYIIVGNCGDSRAVLCRNGKSVPLSIDHKPDRKDEQARIEALGGRIMFTANVARVEGDMFLERVVTSEPEYMFMKRESEDSSLILGSDGLWDVVSSELCCELVHKCQQEDVNGSLGLVGCGGPLYTVVAAALLVRLAMGRRSTDNISVIVVDLRV